MASGVIKELTDIKFIGEDGVTKIPFIERLTIKGVTFTNGVGSTQVEVEGHSLSANAFAVAREPNGSLSVAYVKGNSSNQTITIGLTNTTYNGTHTFAILYFLVL